MKILLFANYNAFTLSIISRLSKEDHRIFVVTGSERKTGLKPKNVFQEYNFSYTSESISYIVDNVEPDIVILGGELNSVSDYLAGITNIIHDLKNPSIKQLIYVSSLSVFSGNTQTLIDESTVPRPVEDVDKAVLMGEKICKEYDEGRNFKVTILRFSQLYGSYKNQYVKNNILTEICDGIIKKQEIESFANKKHILLYIDDAVDVIYRIMGNEVDDQIYHVGSLRRAPYSEEQIMFICKSKIEDMEHIKIIENHQEIAQQNYSFTKLEQLGFREKYVIKEEIERLYSTIKRSKDNKKTIGKIKGSKGDKEVENRIRPYLENLIFFIILSIFIYFTQSTSIHEVIDCYLLYVIIIGIIYGYEQTVFTVILSVISKRYFALSWDVRVLGLTDYSMYMWILQLFTVGVLVGYVKEQYQIKYLDMAEEKKYLKQQLTDIKEINKNDKVIKDLYEERLLNYKDSFGRIYEIVSELDSIEPKGIIFKSIGVIGKIMDTKDVSIYISGGNSDFFRLIASSSQKAKTLKNSLRISDHTAFFDKFEKRQMYINTTLDPNYPMMAEGVYKGEKLESIIMVWSLPFESNNLYQMNVFGVACKLIEGSLNTAYEYIDSIKRSYDPEYDNVLDKEAFDQILEVYKYGVSEEIVEFCMMRVKRGIHINYEDFLATLKKNLRETDYIGIEDQDYMSILLTNTNKKESTYVTRRLENSGIAIEEGALFE